MTTEHDPAAVAGDRVGDALGGDVDPIMPDPDDNGVDAAQLSAELHRRRVAGWRSVPLDDSALRDPWLRRTPEPLGDADLDAWAAASQHLGELGITPIVPVEVEAALQRRTLRRRWYEAVAS